MKLTTYAARRFGDMIICEYFLSCEKYGNFEHLFLQLTEIQGIIIELFFYRTLLDIDL